MGLVPWQSTVQDDAGNAVNGASVEVRSTGAGTPLATLASDSGGTGLANPFTTGADGFAQFWVAAGQYTIEVSSGGSDQTWTVNLNDETDTTIGQYGLGITGPGPEIADIDATDTASGMYNFTGTTTNHASLPTGFSGNSGVIKVDRFNASLLTQSVWRNNFGGGKWTRIYQTSWSDWYQEFSHNNLIGTVSQSGGDPTGAILEEGNNANGYYVRFASGYQICTQHFGTAATSHAWTFPAAFVAITSGQLTLSAMARNSSAGRIITEDFDLSTSSVTLNVWDDAGAAASAQVYATAIGRWF